MTPSEMIERMWPFYMVGIFILLSVYRSENRSMLKISPKGILKFLSLMVPISVMRYIGFKFFLTDDMIDGAADLVGLIPWQTTLGVFWEDAVYTIPLAVLAAKHKGNKTYEKLALPMLIMFMISFGLGHVYQGWLAAIALSFYIPFTLKLGKKYGFGTVMICHILYDMITLLTLKWMVGA